MQKQNKKNALTNICNISKPYQRSIVPIVRYPEIQITAKIINKKGNEESPIVSDTAVATTVLRNIWPIETMLLVEEVIMLCLGVGGKLIGWYKLAKGGLSSAQIDVRLVATVAVKSCAAAIIIAHNHPSGRLEPSYSDLKTTEKIKGGLKLLDIKLADHIILSDKGYCSLNDEGYM